MQTEETGPGTGNRDVDALLYTYKWSSNQLTFAFPTDFSQYGPDYPQNNPPYQFAPFETESQVAARVVFEWRRHL